MTRCYRGRRGCLIPPFRDDKPGKGFTREFTNYDGVDVLCHLRGYKLPI